jgi:hypothetical protein
VREKNKQDKCSWTGINMRAATVGLRASEVGSIGARIYSKFVVQGLLLGASILDRGLGTITFHGVLEVVHIVFIENSNKAAVYRLLMTCSNLRRTV